MSSWFSSKKDTGVLDSSSHLVRVAPEPVDVSTPAGPEYEDSDWGEDYLEYEDPGTWYEEPEVVLGALSLAGAVVLLILVLISIKYRER